MNRSVYVLTVAVMAGAAWAQNPDVIDNVRSTMKSVQQKQDNDMKPVLAAAGMSAQPVQAPAQAGAANAPASAGAANAPASAGGSQASSTAAKPAMKKKTAVSKKTAAAKTLAKTAVAANAPFVAQQGAAAPAQTKPEAPKLEEKKWAMVGKRDPFFSPVVSQTTGSGCSTGKKCLDIGQINLRGIVKSGGGFIAVVTNSLDKAYFLKENDPVFNGYVVKITTDSVVFQETMQDKLGKSFTREVVKKIFTPAV
jgi:Tfp pilus assembly protein PilP